ncbi:MAG: energy transducer TonB [Myxococcales bacterium]|nr:energy transducer TonB [Myxococcales bacterium]
MTRALAISLVVHLAIAGLMARLSLRAPHARQQALQIAVVEKVAAREAPPPPPPPRKPLRVARAQASSPLPAPPTKAPPPPATEARTQTQAPVIITGITLESTTQGGDFAVGVGNTLQGTPSQVARPPEEAKPYKAEKYAPAAQVTELPRPLNGESINLRKYYPPQALKDGFEGDVRLRILIDSDGSVAKVDIIQEPGEGLGEAAARMVKSEYRFSPATVNGTPVATTVPFTVHFTIN